MEELKQKDLIYREEYTSAIVATCSKQVKARGIALLPRHIIACRPSPALSHSTTCRSRY